MHVDNPVFDYLAQNGYNMYGTKDYLVYEDANGVDDFFANYHTRELWKNTPLNNPNDPDAISLSVLQKWASTDSMWDSIYKEALEIMEGKRPGFSESAKRWVTRQSFVDSSGIGRLHSANVKP